jgi:hypothetical protein
MLDFLRWLNHFRYNRWIIIGWYTFLFWAPCTNRRQPLEFFADPYLTFLKKKQIHYLIRNLLEGGVGPAVAVRKNLHVTQWLFISSSSLEVNQGHVTCVRHPPEKGRERRLGRGEGRIRGEAGRTSSLARW